jgi:polysaccharide pyruvyl transferase WcaK-like protein
MSTDQERRKIALFGNFGTGNLGNEATLDAMLYNLRRCAPKAEISCICPRPEDTASKHNIPCFPIRATFSVRKVFGVSRKFDGAKGEFRGRTYGPPRGQRWFRGLAWLKGKLRTSFLEPYRWYKAFATLRGHDMLVMTGTGMLGDFGIRPFGLHYDILAWSIVAKLCRCKLLFVSVGAGPIRHPLSRCFVRAALALADYRSYRDAFSKNYLESIGFEVTNDAVYPDLAFSLPREMLPVDRVRDSQRTVIGVGLMNYHNRLGRSDADGIVHRDYLEKLATLVVRLLEHRFTVRLLIGDVTWDMGTRADLKKLLDERGWKYETGWLIDEPASSVEEILSQLSVTDVVVASRFHNLVLALILNKPVMAISYHEKFEPLMTGMGLAEFCQDIEHIDIDNLMVRLTKLQEGVRNLSVQIAHETEAYRTELYEQYDRIFGCLSTGCMGTGSLSQRMESAAETLAGC